MKVVIGLGCDRGVALSTVEQAIAAALKSINLSQQAICLVATIDKKQDEQAFIQLAEKQPWSWRFFSAEQLAQVEVPSPSAVVLKYMGTPSVSEAAAILAASTDQHDLLLEKYKYRGEDEKNATVSIVKKTEHS